MKISKVNHTRAGVTAREEQKKGILYDNPKKDAKTQLDLSQHVQNLNRKAQSLYSILNNKQITRYNFHPRWILHRYKDIFHNLSKLYPLRVLFKLTTSATLTHLFSAFSPFVTHHCTIYKKFLKNTILCLTFS